MVNMSVCLGGHPSSSRARGARHRLDAARIKAPNSVRMNAASKLIASRTLTDTSAWANSRVVEADLVDPADRPPSYLECLSAEQIGAAVLARYAR